MNKLYLALFGLILVIGITTAGVSLVTQATIPAKEIVVGVTYKNLTFDCGKDKMFLQVKEPNNNFNFQKYEIQMQDICNLTITNIKDWDENDLWEYEGIKSFNKTKLDDMKASAELGVGDLE